MHLFTNIFIYMENILVEYQGGSYAIKLWGGLKGIMQNEAQSLCEIC